MTKRLMGQKKLVTAGNQKKRAHTTERTQQYILTLWKTIEVKIGINCEEENLVFFERVVISHHAWLDGL